MGIEVVSRHRPGTAKKVKDEEHWSSRFGGPLDADPQLPNRGGHWRGWEFHEVQLDPDAGMPALTKCASTIALVADCSGGAMIEDGLPRAEVRPDDLSLNIGAQLQRLSFSGRIRLYLLVIDRSRVLRLCGGAVSALPCLFIPPLHFRDAEITQSMRDLRKCLRDGPRTGLMYCEAYVNSIILRALQRAGWLPLHSPDYKDPLPCATLKAVLDHMYDHVADSTLRSGTLAQVAGLAVDAFRHRFQRSLRTSVHQCLLEIRVEIAADHLAHTSRSVSQIAMDTGFADHSHFSRVFRGRIGQTPSEFRATARGNRRSNPAQAIG